MIEEIVPLYEADQLGAPFRVTLVNSVRRAPDGAITYPEIAGLAAGVGMARLWRDERLTAADLRYLRKASNLTRDELAQAMGADEREVAAYEEGPRPMTVTVEKYVRLHLFDRLRRIDGHDRLDQQFNHMEYVFDQWRPAFTDTGKPIEVMMMHRPTGWEEVRQAQGEGRRP